MSYIDTQAGEEQGAARAVGADGGGALLHGALPPGDGSAGGAFALTRRWVSGKYWGHLVGICFISWVKVSLFLLLSLF